MTTWNTITSTSTTWSQFDVASIVSLQTRLTEVQDILTSLNEGMTSQELSQLVSYDLCLLTASLYFGDTTDEVDAAATEYSDYMTSIYDRLGDEITYWTNHLNRYPSGSAVALALQEYIDVLSDERDFWFHDPLFVLPHGAKGDEWQTDYVSSYFQSVPNTAIRDQKITTYTAEQSILEAKIDAVNALGASGFSITVYAQVSSQSTTWTVI